jgi:hypothetical protein
MPAKSEKTLEDLFHDTLRDILTLNGRSSKRSPKWQERQSLTT